MSEGPMECAQDDECGHHINLETPIKAEVLARITFPPGTVLHAEDGWIVADMPHGEDV